MNRRHGGSSRIALRRWISICAFIVALLMTAPLVIGDTEPPADPALRDYLSANGLLNRGMNDLAAQEYRKFLAEHADHAKAPVARYGLAVALFRTKAYAEAITELDRIAGLPTFEYAAEVQLILGQSHLETQNYSKASQAFQTLLDKAPAHDLADDAAALLTESSYREGKFEAAVKASDLLTQKWSDSPLRERTEFFAALAKSSLHDDAGAAKALTQLQQRFPQGEFAEQVALLRAQSLHRSDDLEPAAEQYRAILQRNKGDTVPDAMLGLAVLLQQDDKNEDAGKLLDQLLQRYPEHRLTATALIQRGRVWLELDKVDEATESFENAQKIKDSPSDETAYWLAKCEVRRGQFAEAATRLTAALKDSPDSALKPEMTYDRAVALMRAGDAAAALTGLAAFRSSFPNHALVPDAIYLQAMIDHEQKRYDKSLANCDVFQSKYASHTLAPSIAFLSAENDFLSDHIEPAAQKYRQFIDGYPKDDQIAKARFRLGSALYRLNQPDQAQAALVQVAQKENTPESFRRALYMLGDIAFQNARWTVAIGYLDDFLGFGLEQPSADDALLKLALSLGRENRRDEALTAYDQLLQNFPKSVHRLQAVFERGQLLLAAQDVDGAASAFSQVLEEGKDSRFAPHAMNHLAAIAMQRQQYDQAARYYEQLNQAAGSTELAPTAIFQRGLALMAAKQFEQAAAAFASFVKQYPRDARIPQAEAQRAIALSRQGQTEKAIEAAQRVFRDYDKSLSPELHAAVMYERAWSLRELKRTEEAAEAYRQLIAAHEREPVTVYAILELAEIESAAKRYKESAELLARVRTIGAAASDAIPVEVAEPALYRLVVAQFELGKHQESADLADEFIRTYPQCKLLASAHLFGGEALFKLGKQQQAAEHFTQIVKNFANDPACESALLRLGESQAALNQWPQSEKTFTEYLKRFGDHELWFQAQFGLGFALENQQKHDDALAAYRKVIERHNGPTAARAQFQVGETFFAQRKYDQAVRELLKVDILYAYPEWSAAALYEAGRCFEELAKPVEARAQFQQVQEKFPDTQWARLAAQRLAASNGRNSSGG